MLSFLLREAVNIIEALEHGGVSKHVHITGGVHYNESSGILTIEGFEHFGLGIGEKAGFKIEIPIRAFKEGKIGF